MTRLVVFAAVLVFLGLVAYDSDLILRRMGAGTGTTLPVDTAKVALAIGSQLTALALATWYSLVVARAEQNSDGLFFLASLRVKLIPLVVLAVFLILATSMLEIGLFCSDQSLQTRRRGGEVCPRK